LGSIVDFDSGRLGRVTLVTKSLSEQKRWKAYPWKTSRNSHKRCGQTFPEETWSPLSILGVVGLVVLLWGQNYQVSKVSGKLTHEKSAKTLRMDVGEHALKKVGGYC
jgi:hypothetical protein